MTDAIGTGTQVNSTTVCLTSSTELDAALVASTSWPRKLRMTPDLASGTTQADLTITGTPSAEEAKAMSNLSGSAEPQSLREAIGALRKQALAPRDII